MVRSFSDEPCCGGLVLVRNWPENVLRQAYGGPMMSLLCRIYKNECHNTLTVAVINGRFAPFANRVAELSCKLEIGFQAYEKKAKSSESKTEPAGSGLGKYKRARNRNRDDKEGARQCWAETWIGRWRENGGQINEKS